MRRLSWPAILLFSTPALAQDIEAFGRACLAAASPNILEVRSDAEGEQAFRKKLCDRVFSRRDGEVNVEASAKVLVLFKASADVNTSTKEINLRDYCNNQSYSMSIKSKLTYISSVASPEALAYWVRCMELYRTQFESRPRPVVGKATPTANGVVFAFKYDANMGAPVPLFRSILTSNLVCERPPLKPGQALRVEETTVGCTWTDPSVSAGYLTVRTSRGDEFVPINRNLAPTGEATIEYQKLQRGVIASEKICNDPVLVPQIVVPMRDGAHELGCISGCTECTADRARYCRVTTGFRLQARGPDRQIHSPRLECARDNRDACGWNGVEDSSRLKITNATPTLLEFQRPFGSRWHLVRACATEDQYGSLPTPATTEPHPLYKGRKVAFSIPDNAVPGSAKLKISQQGKSESLELGKSTPFLKFVPDESRASTFTYVVE
ncbi:MAG TPA: hypothetical protein VF744_04875 [Beijerinckiaceae bacterium]|jgi:hypothetical protein